MLAHVVGITADLNVALGVYVESFEETLLSRFLGPTETLGEAHL